MRLTILPLLLSTSSLTTGAVVQEKGVNGNKDLTIKTTSGTYTGLVNSSLPDVAQWLGIQYGRPPVGKLRFMPPERSVNHGPGLSARSYKPICMQDNGNKTGVFWEIVPEFQNQDQQSEDCLYLNIWGPRNAVARKALAKKDRLPVIVWVCGGSFKEGGGHAPYQVPDHWIQRTQTHLVVTFNYRLNIFGFPGTELARKNAGLLDVRLVVEWLRDNIGGFGGDPNRMVLYGQSAGGGAVLSYLYSYPKDPIVTGFIAASAGANAVNSNETNPNFSKVAQLVGCANLTAAAELDCMRSVDAVKLRDAVVSSNSGFRPIVDGVTQFANLTERLEKGLVPKQPLIAGFTYNEAAAFQPVQTNGSAPPASTLPVSLTCGAKREARARGAYGLKTYTYLYAGNFSNVTPLPQLGGMHSSDIPIVFGTHHLFRGNSTELEWHTSFAMESFWVTFAANSSTAPMDHVGTVWPEHAPKDGQDGKIIVFGDSDGPSASYIASVAAADKFSGPC